MYTCGLVVNGGVSDGHVAMVATSYKGPAPGSERNIPLSALAWQIAPVYDVAALVDPNFFSIHLINSDKQDSFLHDFLQGMATCQSVARLMRHQSPDQYNEGVRSYTASVIIFRVPDEG